MERRIYRHVLMFSAVSALLAACAFPQPTRPVYQPPLPEFESIAVFSKGPSDDLKARFSRESTKSGAAIGFQGGAVAGLGASPACGPWFWLCALGTGSCRTQEVVGQIPRQFVATPADAEALVELELTNVRFAHITDGAFALEVGICCNHAVESSNEVPACIETRLQLSLKSQVYRALGRRGWQQAQHSTG